jgi:hypothetical protein
MANTYLTRSKSSPTSDKKGTISFWIKRTNLTNQQATFVSGGGSIDSNIFFENDGTLQVYDYQSGAYQFRYVTNRVFKDSSAWYHIVVRIDTTDATAGDRVKIYINGVQETSFSVETDPSQNLTPLFFTNAYAFWIGAYRGSSGYTDGLYTHFHYTDGYAYDASTFGETDSTSGIWKPKTAPSVTYGTNGFFLKFENSGAMGTDSSGNSNTFTVSGTLTQNVDTPSNNFATLTPLVSRKGTLTNGNLTHEGSGATAPNNIISSLGVTSGKFYVEAKIITANNYNGFGIVGEKNLAINTTLANYLTSSTNSNSECLQYVYSDIYAPSGVLSGTYATLATNDIGQIALDLNNGYAYFGVNGTWQNSGNPESGSSGTGGIQLSTYFGSDTTYFFGGEQGGASNTRKIEWNFGQGYFGTTAVASAGTAPSEGGIFEYDCPSGYQALCTKGINSF